jgi:hypothetical protein
MQPARPLATIFLVILIPLTAAYVGDLNQELISSEPDTDKQRLNGLRAKINTRKGG